MKKYVLVLGSSIFGFILLIFIVGLLTVSSTNNRTVVLEEAVSSSKSDISKEEQRRVDLFNNLADSIKSYNNHESETLKTVTEARKQAEKGNIQSTGFNKRTIWKGVPAKFGTTFYGDLSEHTLKPIKFPNEDRDSQIRLHANQPINKFLEDELEDNTPHPVIWTIVTIVIMVMIAVGGAVIYTEMH